MHAGVSPFPPALSFSLTLDLTAILQKQPRLSAPLEFKWSLYKVAEAVCCWGPEDSASPGLEQLAAERSCLLSFQGHEVPPKPSI